MPACTRNASGGMIAGLGQTSCVRERLADMPVLANPRWEKFCQEYAKSGNASAAYALAGYKAGPACGPNSARLIARDIIKSRLAELGERVLAAWEVDLKWWTERAKRYASIPDMATTIEEHTMAVKAATPMMDLLAKHLGTLKPTQLEVSGPGGAPIATEALPATTGKNPSEMSDAELRLGIEAAATVPNLTSETPTPPQS